MDDLPPDTSDDDDEFGSTNFETEDGFKCKICDKVLKTKGSLWSHRSR